MDRVDRLYEIYNILHEAGDNVASHEGEFMEILNSVKGSDGEKCLACQFIPKFVGHFPNLSSKALEAQLDLVEDEEISVRKMSIKYLPAICKVQKKFVPKIADVLTQLLLTEDSSELLTVHSSLMAIMELDVKGTLHGMLTQMSTSEEDVLRKRAIEFLSSKIKILTEELFTKEIEEFFLESCEKVFSKICGQDFLNLLPLLSHLKIAKTIPVQNSIVNIIAMQLDNEAEFDVSANNITGFMNFLQQACLFFSPFVSSNKFVSYVCLKIFPLADDIKNLENGHNLILDIFKGLAEISPFIVADKDIGTYSEIVFKELLKFIPIPPENVNENDSDPNLYFTHIECLLYTFVKFLKFDDKFLTAEENEARFKDLKLRLQFLSRVVSRALKGLKESQKRAAVVNDESNLKAIAERTMNNINLLIKDFFRFPPSFKSSICLSWKSIVHTSASGGKRQYETSGRAENVKKERRACRELYVPPSGKYSSRVSFSSKDGSKSAGRSSRF